MERLDLIPEPHRRERLFLLDVLAGSNCPFDVDPGAFLSVTPKKLHPFLFVRLQGRQVPAALSDTLTAAYRRNAMQELRRGAELRRIDATLTGAGIRFLILKGPVLAATVYPDRAARTMTDLDFLIAEDEVKAAMSALERAGYRVPPRFDGLTFAPGDGPPLIHDQPGGPSIELHTMLDSLPNERAALAVTWPSSRRLAIGHGLELPTLDPGEFFAHVAMHVSRHHRFEGELRSLLDVALLLRHEDLDWAPLHTEWRHRGIVEWVELTAVLAHRLLGAPLPEVFAETSASDEALRIASELLWTVDPKTAPPRLVAAISGRTAAPMHDPIPGSSALMPRGWSRVRLRAARGLHYVRQSVTSALRPLAVASAVALHRKREHLFDIVESRHHD